MPIVTPDKAEIELYTWTTPNGRKISILLEELGVPYAVHPVDITAGEQFRPEFLAIGPNNRIPAIIDRRNGRTLMESGAILLYLAESYRRFIPAGEDERWQVLQWLTWQVASMGPMLGQAHHFLKYNPGRSAYAEERYGEEARRLYRVLDKQLEDKAFVAGEYSIADIAIWPFVSRFEWQRIDLAAFPAVSRWYREVAARPAVQAGYNVPAMVNTIPMPNA